MAVTGEFRLNQTPPTPRTRSPPQRMERFGQLSSHLAEQQQEPERRELMARAGSNSRRSRRDRANSRLDDEG